MSIHSEPREVVKHLLQLVHVGFLVNGRIGGDLIAQNFRHADGGDAFLEDAFPFDNEVMGAFQAVEMHIPIHPARWGDAGSVGLARAVSDFGGLIWRDQFLPHKLIDLGGKSSGIFGKRGRQIVAHFFSHEEAVGADIHNALAFQEARHQCFDVGINQGFATAY